MKALTSKTVEEGVIAEAHKNKFVFAMARVLVTLSYSQNWLRASWSARVFESEGFSLGPAHQVTLLGNNDGVDRIFSVTLLIPEATQAILWTGSYLWTAFLRDTDGKVIPGGLFVYTSVNNTMIDIASKEAGELPDHDFQIDLFGTKFF